MSRTRILVIVAVVIAAFTLGRMTGGGSSEAPTGPAAATVWTCSMHPQFQLPEPGQCPVCFMDLIPLEEDAGDDAGPREFAMSAGAAALAGIRTEAVVLGPAPVELRLTGRVDADETRTSEIAARTSGRIDTLFVEVTGSAVRAGEPLASLYAPEIFATQAEMLAAVDGGDRAVADASRSRLLRWGMTEDQVEAVLRRGAASTHVRILAPADGTVVGRNAVEGSYVAEGAQLYAIVDLGRVWVVLDAHESDLPLLAAGREVEVSAAALPGRTFSGVVDFVDPVLDPATRTVDVRLDVDNTDGSLRPGLFVRAVVSGTGDDAVLTIPSSAPLLTGDRAVVYVELPDRDRPTFEGRVVTLGPRAGDRYMVADGLEEGERVVADGAFKIDSALQIQARPSMMNPAESARRIEAPPGFRSRLDAVLAVYLDLQAALAADDDPGAVDAVGRAAEALAAADAELSGELSSLWSEDSGRLRAAFRRIGDAGDIAARRAPLQGLTDALWEALVRWGPGRAETVRLFHCPMAYDDAGGDWIQLGAVTDNPYFGSMMRRCGGQTDTLTVAFPGGGE